jgi:glycogen synthase
MSNKALRIVFWNETYLPRIGGVEIFTERLGRGLIERGHEIYVVTEGPATASPKSETVNGISIHRFPFREAFVSENDPNKHSGAPRQLARITKKITKLKEEVRPDIVHVNFYGPSSYFHLKTARRLPTKTVVTFQTALTTMAGEDGLVQALLREAAVVIAPSRAAARNIALSTGYSLNQISVIAPGVPHGMSPPAIDSGSGLPTVVFLGRLVEDKGADIAVRAMHALKGIANLNIVGDGPQRPALENLARELSLEETVHFFGQVSDDQRGQMIANAFAMVVPSRHEELFGMVAVEGALSSLPVVAASRGGLPEVVKHRETGIIIPPDDPTALSAALRGLLNDRGVASAMGRAGRSRALRKFSLEEAIIRHETLYFKACPDLV